MRSPMKGKTFEKLFNMIEIAIIIILLITALNVAYIINHFVTKFW